MYDLRSISKSLQDAAKEVLEAKKPLHPNQQKIDVHEPEKDEITAKDFEMLRAGKKAKMKEEVEDIDEASQFHVYAKVKGDRMDGPDYDHIKSFSSKEDAQKHISTLPKPKNSMHSYVIRTKKVVSEDNDVMEDADEVLLATPIVVDIKESYMFGDYLTAAKDIVGEEMAIELANYAFNKQDTNLFVEQITRSDIMSKIATHKAAGHQVSEPKYKTKDGKLHAEYVVTDKESGIRRKYIHHGTSRKVENMGAKGKRDDE